MNRNNLQPLLYTTLFFFIFSFSKITAQNLQLSVSSQTVSCETTSVEIDITAANFVEITSLDFSVNWNPDIVSFSEIINVNNRLNGVLFNTTSETTESGALSMSWFNSASATIPANDNVLFTVVFTTTEATASTAVSITDTPTPINYTNVSGDTQPKPQINNGAISINCDAPNSSDLTFTIPNIQPACGQQLVRVDVTTRNFDAISFFSFSVNWDQNKLDFERITNLNSTINLQNSDFNTAPNSVDNGQMSVSWFSNRDIDLPEDAVLFSIEFAPNNTENFSRTLSFSDDPTPTSAGTNNGTEQLSPVLINGQVQLVGSCSDPLAVETVVLQAVTLDAQHVQLSWTTNAPSVFVIERAAGKDAFEEVGRVSTELDAPSTFVDYLAPSGTLLYRLRYTTPTGRVRYSKMVSVQLSARQTWDIYPNPAIEHLTLYSKTPIQHWGIQDVSGKVIRSVVPSTTSTQVVASDIGTLSAGLYFISITNHSGTSTRRLVIGQ